jgi:hypothetical protein
VYRQGLACLGSILDRYVSIPYDPGIDPDRYAISWIFAEPGDKNIAKSSGCNTYKVYSGRNKSWILCEKYSYMKSIVSWLL